jgi:hypothetical protein
LKKKERGEKELWVCRDAVHLLHGGQTKFTTVKVPRLCPLVVLKITGGKVEGWEVEKVR